MRASARRAPRAPRRLSAEMRNSSALSMRRTVPAGARLETAGSGGRPLLTRMAPTTTGDHMPPRVLHHNLDELVIRQGFRTEDGALIRGEALRLGTALREAGIPHLARPSRPASRVRVFALPGAELRL